MSDKIDVEGLRASVDLVELVSRYLPLTKVGAEHKALCPWHDDHTPSLSINGAKQVWACWSCNQHEVNGADVFGFIMSIERIDFHEAIKRLSNGNGSLPDAKPIVRPPLKRAPPRILVVPPAGSMPELERSDFGQPTKVWTIKTPDGLPLLYEARYLNNGRKETRFWTFGRYSEDDPPRWECKHPPNPRAWYGQEHLAARPTAQVMIHEAPKKAEAGERLFPALVHLGVIGGAHQVAHMNVALLAGRRCVLLPDNDEPSFQAMRRLAPLLWAAGAAEVKGINPETGPDDCLNPDGWDIADTENDEKWTPKAALAWAKARTVVYENDAAQQDNKAAAAIPAVCATPSSGNLPNTPGPVAAASPETLQINAGATIATEPIPRPQPVLTVVDGGAMRKPRQEIEPEAEQLPAFSEFALSQRFADGPGQDWRYTAAWNTWARWIGHRWEPDEVKAITWVVKDCCSAAMREHLTESTPSQRMKLTTLKTVNAVATLAGSDPRLATRADAWDANPMLLGTPAGVMDLRTGQLIASERAQMISKSTGVSAAAGEHPWWDCVLERAHRGDERLLQFIQRWCGYLLTGDTREERFLFIHGPGAGGKSKFLAPLADILGDYRRTAKIDSFTARERSEHSEEIARLAGARLVTATETEEGSRWNESRITALTGRDAIAARHMHKSTFEFQPQFKLVFVGNHRPALRSVGEEMRRRIDLIEWGGTIPEAERILDLPQKLRAEYPAILAWMVEGCLAWQREGLGKPAAVETATRDYLSSEDTFGAWIEECVILDAASRCRSGAAYAAFRRWAEQAGEYVPSQKRFSQKLQDRGFQLKRTSSERQFIGFRLKFTDDEAPPPSWLPD